MSGLVLLTAGAVWLGLQHRWRVTAGAAFAAVVLGTLLLGREGPPAAPAEEAKTVSVAVRVIQPHVGDDEQQESVLTHGDDADTHAAPRVVLWPEGALSRYLDAKYAQAAPQEFISPLELAPSLRPGDVLLTGGHSVILGPQGDDDVYHNSVFGVNSDGQLLWRYDKAHLVPFGEFLPLRPILSRLGLSGLVPIDDSPGPGPRTFEVPGFKVDGRPLTVAVDICYEIIFPGRVVDEGHRPAFLFNPSNDAWFGSWEPLQHLAQAQLRAIEEGLPVIITTPDGISAVISPQGKILRRMARPRAGTIDTDLPAALPPTLFSRLGLWTSGVLGLLLGAAGLWVVWGDVWRPLHLRSAELEPPPP
jgi:apolipoprotein N-acyltransferase